jgi:AhpD family alkylhydroperoxidase
MRLDPPAMTTIEPGFDNGDIAAPATPLARVTRPHLDPDLQSLWDISKQRTGEAVIIEALANHPPMLRWYFEDFYGRIFYNKDNAMLVDVRTKELLRLKLSKQHGCLFCNRSNSVDALAVGITQAQIDNMLAPTSAHFSDQDLAVIELAEQMMLQNMNGQLSPALHARLRQYYSDAQLVEMGFVAAVLTGMAKFIFTYDLVSREEICPVRPAIAAE